jgi:hypothetical protein
VGLCQAVGHGQDPAFAGGYGGQIAHATCGPVNQEMRAILPRGEEIAFETALHERPVFVLLS